MKKIFAALVFVSPIFASAANVCAILTPDEKGEYTKISNQHEFQASETSAVFAQMDGSSLIGMFTEKSISVGLVGADQTAKMIAISDGNVAVLFNVEKSYAALCGRSQAALTQKIQTLR